MRFTSIVTRGALVALITGLTQVLVAAPATAAPFEIVEARISDIQRALLAGDITTVELVESYLARIKAYNGRCVKEPEGILGPVSTLPNAGQINALTTLNLRPKALKRWKFDARKARSMTDKLDASPDMPDALEVARAQDEILKSSGKLAGPLHGAVLAIKDQFDTVDLRTTSGADAFYANDRPPDDATFVKKLREAGAIILAKANMGEYAAGARSSFGGTLCNPYDTERSPGGSSGGSGSAVAANLVTCAIAEESGPSIRSPAKNNNVVGISPYAGAREPRRNGACVIHERPRRDRSAATSRTPRRFSTSSRATTPPMSSPCSASAGHRNAPMRVMPLRPRISRSRAFASGCCANTWTRSCSPRPTPKASASSRSNFRRLRS